MEYVRTCYPTFSVTNARLRAEVLSRYVFAAFYQDPDVLVVPGRYKLVAVARQGETVIQLFRFFCRAGK